MRLDGSVDFCQILVTQRGPDTNQIYWSSEETEGERTDSRS